MNMILRTLTLLSVFVSTFVAADDSSRALAEQFHREADLRRIATQQTSIDIKSDFVAYQGDDGQLYFLSKDGRYAVQGMITDTWRRKQIVTIADAQYSETHLSLDYWQLQANQLNTISIGHGPEEILVFADPRCSACKSFIQAAQERPDQYTTKIIVVPAFGGESLTMTKALWCAEDRLNAIDAFMSESLLDLPRRADCDTAGLDRTLMTAHLFNIQAVPFVIAPDGRYRAGVDQHVWRWIRSGS
ncbi:thioredoxin fold domain-containing protein [uncultured Umboniibacter sp.]|uniref:thioredoxin fold domain-containing protein n=1 Tax=uncultured Umboniibacter sp. TaxID=1798917 RepID=UPI002609DF41|nr:thioredoxin fold domain-containing protein [uncultured Umboniibacter sp.]